MGLDITQLNYQLNQLEDNGWDQPTNTPIKDAVNKV